MKRAVRLMLGLAVSTAVVLGPVLPAATGADATGTVEGTVTLPPDVSLGATDSISVQVFRVSDDMVVGDGTADPVTGAFRIEAVPAGTVAVSLRYIGALDLLGEWWGDTHVRAQRRTAALAAGGVVTVTETLERGARLTGRITEGGAAIGWGLAEITSLDGNDPYLGDYEVARANADGTYTSGWMPAGRYSVVYSTDAEGWKRETHNGTWVTGSAAPAGEAPLVLAAGVRTLDVDLDPMGSISGRVTMLSATGVVPVKATINVYAWSAAQGTWVWSGGDRETAADGTFRLVGLAPGDFRLQFTAGGAIDRFWGGADDVDAAATITVHDGEAVSGIDVQLEQQAGITAKVMYRETPGAPAVPLSAVSVELMRLDEASGYYLPADRSSGSLSQGAYASPALRPGTYTARFIADPYSGVGSEYYADARYFYESTDVVLAPGASKDLGTIVLEPREFDIWRVAGADRFATAVQISQWAIPDGQRAPVVYLTNGYNYPDALAAGPAAIHFGGVTLTTLVWALPSVVADELERLQPRRIVLLGDENAVSADVERAVRALAPSDAVITRVGGANRLATADLIVRDAFGAGGARQAIIATAYNFPDALAAGPAAGYADAPVVLVNGGGELEDSTRSLLRDLGVTDVYIAGGTPSVSPRIESDLVGLLGSGHVVRFAGADRYETAALMNEHFFGESEVALLATGWGFADALVGGPLAGALGSPLYLTAPTCLPFPAVTGILEKQVLGVALLGGRPTLAEPLESLTTC